MLVYDVTDRCSFDECTRLKFLINIHGQRKFLKLVAGTAGAQNDIPVALVGNKNDLEHERMISTVECKKKYEELGCTGFYDISVRECIEEVRNIFVELYNSWPKQVKKNSRTSSPLLKDKILSFSEEEQCVSASDNKDDNRNNAVKRKESVSRKIMKRMMSSRRLRVASDGDKPVSWNKTDSHSSFP